MVPPRHIRVRPGRLKEETNVMFWQQYSYWLALVFAILANIAANICFKGAMRPLNFGGDRLPIWMVVMQPLFWLGVLAAGILMITYLLAIRGLSVSVAYISVTSVAMIGILLAERIFFGTSIGYGKILGIVLIISGFILLLRDV